MKILLLTTYPHGGAGTACQRLQAALQAQGHTVDILTAVQIAGKWPFYAERLSFLPYERDKSRPILLFVSQFRARSVKASLGAKCRHFAPSLDKSRFFVAGKHPTISRFR
jgi:hypothetical protein